MMMRGPRFCYPDLQILPVSPSPIYQKQGQHLYKVVADIIRFDQMKSKMQFIAGYDWMLPMSDQT